MKKQLIAMFLIFVLMLSMAGCSTANAVQKLDAAEDKVEAKLDAAEDKVEAKLDAVEEKLEDQIRNTVAPAAPAAPAQSTPTTPPASAPAENTQLLTEEEAVKIALDHLGLTTDQVTRLRAHYEIDDGIPQYDVEFLQGDWEYEFEIHGENGKIISYDKDHKYD